MKEENIKVVESYLKRFETKEIYRLRRLPTTYILKIRLPKNIAARKISERFCQVSFRQSTALKFTATSAKANTSFRILRLTRFSA